MDWLSYSGIVIHLLLIFFQRHKERGPVHVFPQNVEDILSTIKEQTIDLPTHSVTITQMEDLNLAQEDLFLGTNHVGLSPRFTHWICTILF